MAHRPCRPVIDRARVVRTVAGLRPFRPAGVRVERERIGDRTVVHDYGHGGGGVTLSWGTAKRAAELVRATGAHEVAVLGAGAVGLAAARVLQCHGCEVSVYAEGTSPATTSDVAGALWGAFSVLDPGHADPDARAWLAADARASYRAFAELDPVRHGIRHVPLYLVGERPEVPWEMALTPELFPVEQLAPGAHPFAMSAVLRTPAMMVEPARYLTALRESVIAAGGQVVARRFADRAEVLALPQPVIVNCLGLGARTVFGDTTVEPIKGELVILDAQPGIDYAVIALDVDAYLLPRESSVVVGGSFLRGDWSTEVGDATVERILAGARALFAD